MPCVELWIFAILTSILRSQPENDDGSLPHKIIKNCDKKQPQGRIADLLRKQAQQMPSDTGLGLRPTDAPLSRGTKKLDNNFKRPILPRSDTITLVKRRPSAAGDVSPINAAISPVASDTSVDPKRESLVKGSATSWSGFLSQPKRAPALSTQATASRSSGPSTGTLDSGLSLAVHRRTAILSRRQASPASPSTHKKQHHLNSMTRPADILYTQSSRKIPDQASITFTSTYGHEKPVIEATHTRRTAEKLSWSPKEIARGAHMYSTFIFGARLIVCPQLLYHVQYLQLRQLWPYQLLVLRLTYLTSMRPTNFLNRHSPQISSYPSSSTLPVLRLQLYGNPHMITPPCNSLPMMTVNGQRFLNASHDLVGCQVI